MSPAEWQALHQDVTSHTDGQLYSCGSLAPKLRKNRKDGAGRIGGCSSCGVNRPGMPWEATDGCLYLVAEIVVRCCCNGNGNDHDLAHLLPDHRLVAWMETVVDVCRVSHFPQANDLRATLWKVLPLMGQALGKQRFKRHVLDLVLPLLMRDLQQQQQHQSTAASPLTLHAARQCLSYLADLVSPGILLGRLQDDEERWTAQGVLLREQEQQQQQHAMAVGNNNMDDGFSSSSSVYPVKLMPFDEATALSPFTL